MKFRMSKSSTQLKKVETSTDDTSKKTDTPLLDIQNLIVDYPTKESNVRAVNNVSFKLYPKEVVGLVGESGCGKSTLGFSILGLLKGGFIQGGKILFEGKDLREISDKEIKEYYKRINVHSWGLTASLFVTVTVLLSLIAFIGLFIFGQEFFIGFLYLAEIFSLIDFVILFFLLFRYKTRVNTIQVKIPEEKLRNHRGSDISMIFQASQDALNPLQTVSNHFKDTIKVHKKINRSKESWNIVLNLLQKLEIPESRLKDYPFQFSGGMQQRIVIALALLLNPKLIIADEPTTALDVLVQARILRLLKTIQNDFDLTIIYISHDLGVVAELTHRVFIMYAGQIVEEGRTSTIFNDPAHPYTRGLISAIPNVKDDTKKKMTSIPGRPPDLREITDSCRFANRCQYTIDMCKDKEPCYYSISDNDDSKHFVKCWKYNVKYSSQFK